MKKPIKNLYNQKFDKPLKEEPIRKKFVDFLKRKKDEVEIRNRHGVFIGTLIYEWEEWKLRTENDLGFEFLKPILEKIEELNSEVQ